MNPATRRRPLIWVGLLAVLVVAAIVIAFVRAGDDAREEVSAPEPTPAPTPTTQPTASPPPPETPSPTPTLTPTPTPTPDPASQLPDATTWTPADTEVRPEAKQAATQVVEALGTAGRDAPDAAQRLADVGADPDLADQAGPLLPPAEPAVVEVVYPQYGGLEEDAASVMMVVRQTWLADGEPQTQTLTVDARVERVDDEWQVGALLPENPPEQLPDTGVVGELASRTDLDLPPTALVDLTHPDSRPVAEVLNELAREWSMSVSVVRRGHPEEVFGTDRRSYHAIGRAVDIWAIEGRAVVEMAPDDPMLAAFLQDAAELGVTSVGSPVDLDGDPDERPYFTDDLHRDHVHLGLNY